MKPRNTVACPACDVSRPLSEAEEILKWRSCSHRWMIISDGDQKSVEDTVYTIDYAGYRADAVFERTVRLVLDNQIAARKPASAEILDVGCGTGDFLTTAIEHGYKAIGIDVSEASAAICRSRGYEAVARDYLAHDFGNRFDIITMWVAIEHLRDPGAFFTRTRQLLHDGGIFFGKVPGIGNLSVSNSNRLPRLAGALLGASAHLQHFNEASLGRLAGRPGIKPNWLPRIVGSLRAPPARGSFKRRLGRNVARSVTTASGIAVFISARPKTELLHQ